MPFLIIRNDITKVTADAIVNTANPLPVIGDGCDRSIYQASGENQLLDERKKIGDIARGDIAVTPAFNLDADYIIHAVGPVWQDGEHGEYDILRSCYKKSLWKAHELGCGSIAFPLMATGVYGFPKDKALQIAMSEISEFLMTDSVEMTVYLVVFDNKAFCLSQNLFFQVESFITDEEVKHAHINEYALDDEMYLSRKRRYQAEMQYFYRANSRVLDFSDECELPENTYSPVFDEHTFDSSLYMNDGKEQLIFLDFLLKLLIKKDIDNATAWKKSNISKGAFSKIMCGDTKVPKKSAVLGLCIGLELTLEEANKLLACAGFALNPYDKRDQLVVQCITREQYNIDAVNAMLYLCNQPLLGNDHASLKAAE